jgi:predicted nucleic acid-binding protein
MVYADTDFFIALVKEDDWLQENAEKLYNENSGNLETSLPTFIELCLLSEEYDWNLERAFTNILEFTEIDFDEAVLYQALEYMEEGLNVFDAFQAASSSGKIISSDKEFDSIDIERVRLED